MDATLIHIIGEMEFTLVIYSTCRHMCDFNYTYSSEVLTYAYKLLSSNESSAMSYSVTKFTSLQ